MNTKNMINTVRNLLEEMQHSVLVTKSGDSASGLVFYSDGSYRHVNGATLWVGVNEGLLNKEFDEEKLEWIYTLSGKEIWG